MVEQRGQAEPVSGGAPTVCADPPTAPGPVVGKRRWPLLALAGLLLLALGGAGGWLARGAVTPVSATTVAAPVAATPTTTTPTVPQPPVAGPPIVPATSAPAGDGPALGRSRGAQRGYGAVQPAEIDGGSDRGVVYGITWEDWGEDRATGRGTALYRPDRDSDDSEDNGDSANTAGGVQDRAIVVAFDLGDCDGEETYRRVTWYFPQQGESFREGDAQELCD